MEGRGGGVGPLIWYSCIDRKLDVIFYFVMHGIESLDMRQLHRECLALYSLLYEILHVASSFFSWNS